jgi:hypothetical protein
MPRVLRRFLLLLLALLVPVYAISLTEHLEIPAQWREIRVGDSHDQVRARLRESGMDDAQCEWISALSSVRCTLMGRHHACGVAIRFGGSGAGAHVVQVQIRDPIYTGPFHMHARLRSTAQ